MKKWAIITFVCLSLMMVSLVPAQAQVTSFNLDFSGGVGDCVSWINGVGGGYLSAVLSGGVDTILTSNNAGGVAPECNFAPMTAIYINLVGITADSFIVQTTGILDFTLYSGGLGGTVVYSTSAGVGTYGQVGSTYDTIELLSNGGTDLDNISIGQVGGPGTASSSAPGVPRINVGDNGAPVALFCTVGGGLDIYDIQGDQGTLAHRISDQVLANAIATAQSSGHNVLLISDADAEVWALTTGEIQVNTGGYAYGFTYQGVCGALPKPNLVGGSDVQDQEDNGVIINRPR